MRWYAGVPAFLVGLATALAGEIALGLLLYSGPGFIRALTLTVGTLLGCLSLGLWAGPVPPGAERIDAIRQRWMLALVAFVGAAVAAGVWNVTGGLAASGLARGLGLALLAGFPLYAAGAVLGGMSSGEAARRRAAPVAVAATLGATVGVILAGVVLLSVVAPVTALVLCLVLISGAALVHGRILAREPDREVLAEAVSPFGDVRVEEIRESPSHREELRVEVEGVLRGGVDGRGAPLRAWEAAAMQLLLAPAGRFGTGGSGTQGGVLVAGAGAVPLVKGVLAVGRRVEVVEGDPEVLRLVWLHLGGPAAAVDVEIRQEDPAEALRGARGPYAAIVVDGDAFAPGSPLPLPAAPVLAGALGALTPEGVVLLGGRRAAPLESEAGGRHLRDMARAAGAASVAVYAGDGGALVALGRSGGWAWPAALAGLERRSLWEMDTAERPGTPIGEP